MARPKTTWEDLANLGWHRQEVFNTFNAARGGTMSGFSDLSLNEGLSETYSWFCYNSFKGPARQGDPRFEETKTETVLWEYHNKLSEVFEDKWKESWTNSTETSLAITEQATIALDTDISIRNMFNTGINLTVASDSTNTVSRSESYELSHEWTLRVGPGETLRFVREKSVTKGRQVYMQDYGLASGGDYIGTKGNLYNKHFYWAFSLNNSLGNPHGTTHLLGTQEIVQYKFRLERDPGDGGPTKIEQPEVSTPVRSTMTDADGNESVREYALPGGEEEGA